MGRILIGLHGRKRSGKTTASEILKKIFENHGMTVEMLSFADPIKKAMCSLFTIDYDTLESTKETPIKRLCDKTPRQLMCELGEFARKQNENALIHNIHMQLIHSKADVVILTDVRLNQEADLIRQQRGLILRIDADIRLRLESKTKIDITEKGIDSKYHDHTIFNNLELDHYQNSIIKFANDVLI
jgi:uridine kinase